MENVQKFPQLIRTEIKEFDLVEGKTVSKKRLVNILNYINFQNGTLFINLKHIKYNHRISHQVRPLPCLGDEFSCVWVDTNRLHQYLQSYTFQDLIVPDGNRILLVKAELIHMNENEICFHLPEESFELSSRKGQRHSCEGISVQLIQSSACFKGALMEFSPFSFCVEIYEKPPQTFKWIDPERPVNVIFFDKNETYYTGACKIIRQTKDRGTRNYILVPLDDQVRRFKPKEYRSTRQQLLPLPNIIFTHPFTKKIENRKVVNLSGSGFAVEEDEDIAVLLPGMIIPDIELNFANSFRVQCKAQVIYRKKSDLDEEIDNRLKCGLALLDIDIEEHQKLLAIIHQAIDSKSYLGSQVDMDTLWEFLFNSGFIYPQKYTFIEANKEKIKATYNRLYNENPSIARHFICQENDRILGHLSTVRFYENAWLVHHHVASRSGQTRAGIVVLNLFGRFLNASYNLYSLHMDYFICYYRPENKFPSRVFGGVARYINDPKKCSIDCFAYFHYFNAMNREFKIEEPWGLSKTTPEDLIELESFYEYSSSGLMMDALDLNPAMLDNNELSKEYQRLGFKREKYLFTLKKGDRIKAIFLVCISDIGLNLSELTNCIKAFVMDSNDLPRNIFLRVLSMLSDRFNNQDIPILIFPVSYADNQSVPYEKLYNLWVISPHFGGNQYFAFMKKLLRSDMF